MILWVVWHRTTVLSINKCWIKGQYEQSILYHWKVWTAATHLTTALSWVEIAMMKTDTVSHVEIIDRWSWVKRCQSLHSKMQLIASVLTVHTATHTNPKREKVERRGEPVIREHFSSLISIACLMSRNTSGSCRQQPSLIILKRNTTPTQLELSTLLST